MTRRAFLAFAALGALTPLARAQAVRRIGWLTGGSPASHAKLLAAFRDGLRSHGWVEGRNIALELRWAEGDNSRLPVLASELVRLAPEVIVSAATVVHLAVRQETAGIPIVMVTGTDPVEAGLVASLARPGGNVTGLSGFFEATPVKMLELVAGMVPRQSRVRVLVDVNTLFSRVDYRREVEHTATTVGLRVEFAEVATPDQTRMALSASGTSLPAALMLLPSPMFFFLARELPTRAAALKVPVVYPFEECAEAGGLMSYAAPLADNYRRAAYYVDRILRGARPGDLPIEQPTRLALAINLKTARAQGITIPQPILLRAERVIE